MKIEPLKGPVFDSAVCVKLNELINAFNASQEKEEPMEDGELFWLFDSSGAVIQQYWHDDVLSKHVRDLGNIFKTREAAESARDKVKELLRSLRV